MRSESTGRQNVEPVLHKSTKIQKKTLALPWTKKTQKVSDFFLQNQNDKLIRIDIEDFFGLWTLDFDCLIKGCSKNKVFFSFGMKPARIKQFEATMNSKLDGNLISKTFNQWKRERNSA